jgi:nitroreductase
MSQPWNTREEDFPANGTESEQLRFLVRYAVLVPSGHNTQPWLFRAGEGCLDLFAAIPRRRTTRRGYQGRTISDVLCRAYVATAVEARIGLTHAGRRRGLPGTDRGSRGGG